MPVQFSVAPAGVLAMQPGIPYDYTGSMITGSSATYANTGFGQIIVQEISNLQYTIRYNVYRLLKQVRLNFRREEIGLQTIAILQDRCRTTINGAGRFRIGRGYFSSLYTAAWEGVLECDANTILTSFETTWTDKFLEDFLPEDSAWKKIFPQKFSDIPFIIGHPYRKITPALYELIRQLMYSSYDHSLRACQLDDLLKNYLAEVLQEIDNPHWLKETISKEHLEKIEMAKLLIGQDLRHHLHTKEIARMLNMNECKLKTLFIKATGMSTFDYMMYLRCAAVRDKILNSDLPLKVFVEEAGYSDLANFVNGFKRHMGCTPNEVRRQ